MPVEKDIRFILRDPKSDKPSPVYLKYACCDGVMKYSTGKKISTQRDTAGNFLYWDEKMQRPKDKKACKTLDKQITNLTSAAMKYITGKEKAGESVRSLDLYNHLASTEPDRKKEKVSIELSPFFSQVKELIISAKAGKLTISSGKRKGQFYSKGTLVHWELAYTKLYEFDPNLNWNISLDDYTRFISWCNEKEQNFRPNYAGTIIKMWKVFMNLGLKKNWHKNIVHLDKDFHKLTEKVHKVYLDENEIQKLIGLKLTGTQKLVRDSFIINLNTGLRISDHKRLEIKDYKDGLITSINRKTGNTTAVPASSEVRRILEEYNGFPPICHEYTINRIIKEIAKLAEIDEEIVFVEKIGGVDVKRRIPKYNLISTHTCRRSFITNNLKKKMPVNDLAKFAGSTIKNIEHYNKEQVQETAKRYIGSEFFK